jgi:hypothetical protein
VCAIKVTQFSSQKGQKNLSIICISEASNSWKGTWDEDILYNFPLFTDLVLDWLNKMGYMQGEKVVNQAWQLGIE